MGDMLSLFDKFDAQCKARAAAAGQVHSPKKDCVWGGVV